jgi:hypothetical protein
MYVGRCAQGVSKQDARDGDPMRVQRGAIFCGRGGS